MALYDAFRELPLHVEEVVTTIHSHRISDEFERKTTVVHLRPEPYFRHIGPEGMGEDVTYDPEEADAGDHRGLPGRDRHEPLLARRRDDPDSAHVDPEHRQPVGADDPRRDERQEHEAGCCSPHT
jgi:hypothetical protein